MIVLISFLHATFMKIENDSVHEIRFKKKLLILSGAGDKYLSKVFLG